MKEYSYEEGRKLIKNGDVVFIRGKKNPVATAIRFFTRSKYSHVGIAFWATISGKKRLMMVEAQGGNKRRIVNMSYYYGVNLDIIAAPKKWTEISEKALLSLGQIKYGWLEAIYVGLREFLLNYLGIKLPRKNFAGEICSEYVANILELPKKHISPQKLFEQIVERGHKQRLNIR